MKTKISFICMMLALIFSIGMNISQHNQGNAFEKQKQAIVSDITYCDWQIAYNEQKVQEKKETMAKYAEGSYAYEANHKEVIRYQKFAYELNDYRAKMVKLLMSS